MKTVEALAELLIAERKKRNLSQKDMRILIGMSQQHPHFDQWFSADRCFGGKFN